MQKFNISGMSCAACSARVEKAVSEVPGITSCSVNLLTNTMITEGTASQESIISAVENAGYGAVPDGEKKKTEESDISGRKELSAMKTRLITSAVLLVVLMYFSILVNFLY